MYIPFLPCCLVFVCVPWIVSLVKIRPFLSNPNVWTKRAAMMRCKNHLQGLRLIRGEILPGGGDREIMRTHGSGARAEFAVLSSAEARI
jgi:hypothetical protein